MVEFNPDGSIKLPGKVAEKKQSDLNKMKNTRCMQVRKEVVSTRSPKSCELFLTLSEKITDNRFVLNIFEQIKSKAECDMKISQVSEREFRIMIGTSFRRCSDCCTLVNRYREFLYSNLIESKIGCNFEQNRGGSFSYEDYFD